MWYTNEDWELAYLRLRRCDLEKNVASEERGKKVRDGDDDGVVVCVSFFFNGDAYPFAAAVCSGSTRFCWSDGCFHHSHQCREGGR